MAKIKYSDEQEPLKKKHYGFTFIRNATNYSMFPAQRNQRTRKTNQMAKMQNLQKAVRFWRTMPENVKESWETFAATYPQPSKRVTGIPLTGYQLFIKRNHYCFLNSGLTSDFLELPELVSLPDGAPVFTLQSGLNTIDLTQNYIQYFGIIPSPGQWLIFAAVPYSEISGQFFPVIYQSIQVLETYIDGFFLNIEMPTIQPSIIYSVYLSKPVNPGQQHKSSKVRYMGCFTTKSFLGLSDTPETYAGQAGKVVTVKDDETGLDFSTIGGGGLTCETLPDCQTVITIEDQIQSIIDWIFLGNNVSIPAVKFGILYNWFSAVDPLLPSSANWRLPTYPEIQSLITFYGGTAICGNPLKDTDSNYWLTTGNLATNASTLQFRGGGQRNSDSGVFSLLKSNGYIWASTAQSILNGYILGLKYNIPGTSGVFVGKRSGLSVRLINPNSTLTEGSRGKYVGNNGRVYRTIKRNGVEWMADNLNETMFSDGSYIPEVTDANAWKVLATSAMCAYNNSWDNV